MRQNWNAFLSTLYTEEYQKLYRSAYRMTGSPETAQDLVQDTFVLAYLHQDELSVHPAPQAWLMLTLRNLTKNEQRKYLAHSAVPLETVAELAAPDREEPIEELLPAELSAQDRQVLLWRFEYQMDYREMADRLGISESGCRGCVFRAIARYRKLLNRDSQDPSS